MTSTSARARRLAGLVVAGTVTLTACSTTFQGGAEANDPPPAATSSASAAPTDTVTVSTDSGAVDTHPPPSTEPTAPSTEAPPDPTPATTEQPPTTTELPPEALCTEKQLSDDEGVITFTAVHRITAGELGPLCFGEPDDTLIRAWDELAVIASGRLDGVVGFGGFHAFGEETDILAFVTAVDEEGTGFQVSVNLAAADEFPEELQLTMAHELTHVFTATPDQIDRFGSDDCPTYFNGEGCYLPGSTMAAWVDAFWYDELLDQIDPFEDASADEAEERCAHDAGFFGSYAATSPEEDFAQSFSAYVYRLQPDTWQQQVRIDWIDARPELAEFRARAIDAGRGPLPNLFAICGE